MAERRDDCTLLQLADRAQARRWLPRASCRAADGRFRASRRTAPSPRSDSGSPRERAARRGAEDVSSTPSSGATAVGPAASPPTQILVERIPQCRTAWSGRRRHAGPRAARSAERRSAEGSSPAARMAAQLDGIDQRASRFQQRRQPAGERRRRVRQLLAWFDAVTTALQTPDRDARLSRSTGSRVQCADIAGAVATLARSNGRMLAVARLAWHRSRNA